MKVKVTLTRSLIGKKEDQVRTAKALGLNKINQSIVIENPNESILGMVKKIHHFVKVEEV